MHAAHAARRGTSTRTPRRRPARGGTSAAQRAEADAQRGANAQPGGSAARSGGEPPMVGSGCPRCAVARHASRAGPRCTGGAATARSPAAGARPRRCGRRTSPQCGPPTSTATPMSWVTKITRQAQLALQLAQQQQHLDLHRGVERRGRLVGQQHLRAGRPAPARSSRAGACRRTSRADSCRAGVPRDGIRTRSNSLERARRGRRERHAASCALHGFGDLVADLVDRIERKAGLLEDHRHRAGRDSAAARWPSSPARRWPSTVTAPLMRVRGRGMQPQQRAQRHALARAGFAEQRERPRRGASVEAQTPATARTAGARR